VSQSPSVGAVTDSSPSGASAHGGAENSEDARQPNTFDPDAQPSEAPPPPGFVAGSPRLASAYALAAEAHRSQRRPTDRALFLHHALEVATLLHNAGFDEELIAAGLLHDAVERGTLTEEGLRWAMGEDVSSLVLSLSEDESIESFDERKAALREQVRAAGGSALAIFAADKLSDMRGLRMAIEHNRGSIEARMGVTIDAMVGHYSQSVQMIEDGNPESVFMPALREELQRLTIRSGDLG
jgi:guanosine-3',5'-bis(diphosphate) 3'-pyrophosphohydrolase